ncbi:ankyrin repeat-containing domain protein [Gorgonomyces haynaldii]|nr:ankyrin repeat-containing domain protein [Gorgonomyces haynaldii]
MLPLEVLIKIGSLLNVQDLLELRLTCKFISQLNPRLSFDLYRESCEMYPKLKARLLMNTFDRTVFEFVLKQKHHAMEYTQRFIHQLDSFDIERVWILQCNKGSLENLVWLSGYIDPLVFDELCLRKASEYGYHDVFQWLCPMSKDLNPMVRLVCKYGHLSLLQDLVKMGVSLTEQDNGALRWACSNGNVEIAKYLLQFRGVNPSAQDNYCIRWAVMGGHLSVVEMLLQDSRVDPRVDNDFCLKQALKHGDIKMVLLLLQDGRCDPQDLLHQCVHTQLELVQLMTNDPRVDPASDNQKALKRACEHGKQDIVKHLLSIPAVDPSLDEECLVNACKWGHQKIVKILLRDKRLVPQHNDNLALYVAEQQKHHHIVQLLMADWRVTGLPKFFPTKKKCKRFLQKTNCKKVYLPYYELQK